MVGENFEIYPFEMAKNAHFQTFYLEKYMFFPDAEVKNYIVFPDKNLRLTIFILEISCTFPFTSVSTSP